MRELKLVKQLDKHGCTIACIAMLTGKSYFRMREILHDRLDQFRHFVEPTKIGLNCEPFRNALKDLFDIDSQFIKFYSLELLETTCAVTICSLAGPYAGQHTVIFDHIAGKILDPLDKITTLDNHNVANCISIC